MTDEETKSFENQLKEHLDQHDYSLPKVGDIRKGVIVAISQQGIIVDLGLKRDGLVPATDLAKLEPNERNALKVNDEINVYVLNSEKSDSLTVSINLARLNQDWIEAEALLENGEIVEGEVIGYNKGGAIIPLGRLRGFIPISHLAEFSPGMNDRARQQKLAKLRGEKMPLKVIEVNRRRHRLVLSQRDAQKEWEEKRKAELLESLQKGDVLQGRISGLRDFGIFVDIGGADGLVHISELAWHRVNHPREVVKVGDDIEVQVLKLDREAQRIGLSRKRLLINPWTTVESRYQINQLVEGKITRIVEYGAFAEIELGIEGLLHISQLSRSPVERVNEIVAENEIHLLRIVSIDQQRQRIGLSLKAVTAAEQIDWMAQKQAREEEWAESNNEVLTDEALTNEVENFDFEADEAAEKEPEAAIDSKVDEEE